MRGLLKKITGAVALVAIGSTLPATFQHSTPLRGLDARKAATILERLTGAERWRRRRHRCPGITCHRVGSAVDAGARGVSPERKHRRRCHSLQYPYLSTTS